MESSRPSFLKMHIEDGLKKIDPRTHRFVLEVKLISGCCCENCDALNDTRIDLNEIHNNQILSTLECTNAKGCNCTYAIVPKRNRSGQLIFNRRK